MADELGYDSQANSGDTLYAHVTNELGKVWNGSAYEDSINANWGDYDVAMPERVPGALIGKFRGDMPTGAASVGFCNYTVYKQAGGSPAVGDKELGWSPSFGWDGSAVVPPLTAAEVNAKMVDVLTIDTPVDGKSITHVLAIMAAGVLGKVSGAATGTEVFVGLDGVTERATVTVDNIGNRSAVTYPGA